MSLFTEDPHKLRPCCRQLLVGHHAEQSAHETLHRDRALLFGHNVIDRLRDCMLMLVVSAQAFESLIPPQTKEQAEVLALNLKNLVMYRAASEVDALRCANALGKHYIERSTRTVHLDHTAHTYQRTEEYRIKPHEFRSLPDHTAVVRHCTNGFKKVCLRPA